VDGDGVVAWGEVGVGGGVACRMVLTTYIIIGRANAVITLQVDCPRRTKIDIELAENVVVGYSWILDVDLVVAMVTTPMVKNNFSVVSIDG